MTLTTRTATTTTVQKFVVASSLEFESTGSREDVAEAVTVYLAGAFGVGQGELSVAVSAAGGRRLQGSSAWQVDYEIAAAEEVAARHQSQARAMRDDVATTSAAMATAFQDQGLALEEESLVVAEPEMKVVTVTATSPTSTEMTITVTPTATITTAAAAVATIASGTPAATECANSPGWADSEYVTLGIGTCADYEKFQWCTSSGRVGPGWDKAWGTLANFSSEGVSASEACCACGGGTKAGVAAAPAGQCSQVNLLAVDSYAEVGRLEWTQDASAGALCGFVGALAVLSLLACVADCKGTPNQGWRTRHFLVRDVEALQRTDGCLHGLLGGMRGILQEILPAVLEPLVDVGDALMVRLGKNLEQAPPEHDGLTMAAIKLLARSASRQAGAELSMHTDDLRFLTSEKMKAEVAKPQSNAPLPPGTTSWTSIPPGITSWTSAPPGTSTCSGPPGTTSSMSTPPASSQTSVLSGCSQLTIVTRAVGGPVAAGGDPARPLLQRLERPSRRLLRDLQGPSPRSGDMGVLDADGEIKATHASPTPRPLPRDLQGPSPRGGDMGVLDAEGEKEGPHAAPTLRPLLCDSQGPSPRSADLGFLDADGEIEATLTRDLQGPSPRSADLGFLGAEGEEEGHAAPTPARDARSGYRMEMDCDNGIVNVRSPASAASKGGDAGGSAAAASPSGAGCGAATSRESTFVGIMESPRGESIPSTRSPSGGSSRVGKQVTPQTSTAGKQETPQTSEAEKGPPSAAQAEAGSPRRRGWTLAELAAVSASCRDRLAKLTRMRASLAERQQQCSVRHARWRQLPVMTCRSFLLQGPIGSVFLGSIITSHSMRSLFLLCHLLGAPALAAALLVAVVGAGSKSNSRQCDQNCAQESCEWWQTQTFGLLLVIALVSSMLARIPLGVLRSLHSRRLEHVGSRDQMERAERRWLRNDFVIWAVGASYCLFCSIFVVLFFANVSSGDRSRWLACVAMTLAQDLLVGPFLAALAAPLLALSLLACLGRRQKVAKLQLIQRHQDDILSWHACSGNESAADSGAILAGPGAPLEVQGPGAAGDGTDSGTDDDMPDLVPVLHEEGAVSCKSEEELIAI